MNGKIVDNSQVVDNNLYGVLNWSIRFKVSMGATRGLVGLTGHDGSFMNRDLWEIGNVVIEYSSIVVASLKGDVYWFGIVISELFIGKNLLNGVGQ